MNQENLQRSCECLKNVSIEMLNEHFLFSLKKGDNLMEFFLQMGADPNIENGLAMQSMADIGNLDNIKLLRKYGAKVKKINLCEAIKHGFKNVVAYLLTEGKRPTFEETESAIRLNDQQMVKILLDHKSSIGASEMLVAFKVSDDMVNLILQYTNNEFPILTFHDWEYYWGYLRNLPSERMASFFKILKNEPQKMAEMIKYGNENYYSWHLEFCLKEALKKYMKQADCIGIKSILDFFEENKILDTIEIPDEFFSSVKNAEQLNDFLEYFKRHNFCANHLLYKYNLCKKGSIKTLAIAGILPDHECLEIAIKHSNKKLVEELLNSGIKPCKDDFENILKKNPTVDYYTDIVKPDVFEMAKLIALYEFVD